ncbi:uncharacterized protein [Paramisgurnus dabryanus]|uniref:uncharacterized protein n=2 Tax=Paramisgurnus dabryanus TaxID=90735 RepID=UPI003CCF7A51
MYPHKERKIKGIDTRSDASSQPVPAQRDRGETEGPPESYFILTFNRLLNVYVYDAGIFKKQPTYHHFDQIDQLLNSTLINVEEQSDTRNSDLQVNAPAINEGSQGVNEGCELQDAALLVTQPGFVTQNTSTKSSRLSLSRKRKQSRSITRDKRVCPDNALVSDVQPRDTTTDFIKTVDFYTENLLGAGDVTNSWSAALASVSEANGDAIVPVATTVLTSSLDSQTSAAVNLPRVVGARGEDESSMIFETSLPANQEHFNNELLLELIAQVRRLTEDVASINSRCTAQEALLRSLAEGIAAIISWAKDQQVLTRLIFEAHQKTSEEQNLVNRLLLDRLVNIEKVQRKEFDLQGGTVILLQQVKDAVSHNNGL